MTNDELLVVVARLWYKRTLIFRFSVNTPFRRPRIGQHGEGPSIISHGAELLNLSAGWWLFEGSESDTSQDRLRTT